MTPRRFDPAYLDRLYAVEEIVDQRRRIARLLAPASGDRVLDAGCGPGYLTLKLAEAVGPDGEVVGVDRDEDMLAVARERAARHPTGDRASFTAGDVTALDLADASVDRAVVVQVLEYVADVAGALAELRRVVRPGGRLVVVDTDWRSCVWDSEDRARMDHVLGRWEDHFTHPHLPARLPALLATAGFAQVDVQVLPLVDVNVRGRDSYSLGMANTIAGFLRPDEPDLAEAWRTDLRARAEAGRYFFSLCRFAVVAS